MQSAPTHIDPPVTRPVAATPIAPGSLGAWILACRPATLTAAIVPVLVGTAVAHLAGTIRIGGAVAALFGALMIQIGTNFANDVFDFEKGADTSTRLGPARATQSGLLTPRQMRRGMMASMLLATLAGVYLAYIAGWPIIAIGIASVLSGIAYTGGPWPLGYHGLGDVFVFVWFGLVAVTGTAFAQLGFVPAVAWFAAIPVGTLATAVLVVNNLRDRSTDATCGKRTLVVRLGRRAGLVEYAALVAIAHLVPIAIAWGLGSAWMLLPVLTLPVGLVLVRGVGRAEGRALNPYLGRTAKLLLANGALMCAALLLCAARG